MGEVLAAAKAQEAMDSLKGQNIRCKVRGQILGIIEAGHVLHGGSCRRG